MKAVTLLQYIPHHNTITHDIDEKECSLATFGRSQHSSCRIRCKPAESAHITQESIEQIILLPQSVAFVSIEPRFSQGLTTCVQVSSRNGNDPNRELQEKLGGSL